MWKLLVHFAGLEGRVCKLLLAVEASKIYNLLQNPRHFLTMSDFKKLEGFFSSPEAHHDLLPVTKVFSHLDCFLVVKKDDTVLVLGAGVDCTLSATVSWLSSSPRSWVAPSQNVHSADFLVLRCPYISFLTHPHGVLQPFLDLHLRLTVDIHVELLMGTFNAWSTTTSTVYSPALSQQGLFHKSPCRID